MRFLILIILIFFNLVVFAQRKNYAKFNKRVGVKTYVDFIVGLEANIAYLDKNPNNLYCIYFSPLFNNKYYSGMFFEQKIGVTSANTTTEGNKYYGGNLKYASGGVYLGFYKVFSKKKTRSDFIKRLTRLNVSLKAGLGRDMVLDKVTHQQLDRKDYLLVVIPAIGVERPVSHFIAVGIGANYHLIRRSDRYYSNNGISGLGGYISIRFSLFNNPFVQGKPPGF
jgi:hypothetical protein